jgi:hypothetical protein
MFRRVIPGGSTASTMLQILTRSHIPHVTHRPNSRVAAPIQHTGSIAVVGDGFNALRQAVAIQAHNRGSQVAIIGDSNSWSFRGSDEHALGQNKSGLGFTQTYSQQFGQRRDLRRIAEENIHKFLAGGGVLIPGHAVGFDPKGVVIDGKQKFFATKCTVDARGPGPQKPILDSWKGHGIDLMQATDFLSMTSQEQKAFLANIPELYNAGWGLTQAWATMAVLPHRPINGILSMSGTVPESLVRSAGLGYLNSAVCKNVIIKNITRINNLGTLELHAWDDKAKKSSPLLNRFGQPMFMPLRENAVVMFATGFDSNPILRLYAEAKSFTKLVDKRDDRIVVGATTSIGDHTVTVMPNTLNALLRRIELDPDQHFGYPMNSVLYPTVSFPHVAKMQQAFAMEQPGHVFNFFTATESELLGRLCVMYPDLPPTDVMDGASIIHTLIHESGDRGPNLNELIRAVGFLVPGLHLDTKFFAPHVDSAKHTIHDIVDDIRPYRSNLVVSVRNCTACHEEMFGSMDTLRKTVRIQAKIDAHLDAAVAEGKGPKTSSKPASSSDSLVQDAQSAEVRAETPKHGR